jgi:hypothetical protein
MTPNHDPGVRHVLMSLYKSVARAKKAKSTLTGRYLLLVAEFCMV